MNTTIPALALALTVVASATASAHAAGPLPFSRSASGFVRDIELGINIGNTLDCPGGETEWGNRPITRGLIQLYKGKGINAVRVPVTWRRQFDRDDANHTISTVFLDRVQDVVDLCISEGMVAILNIHHDETQFEPSGKHYEESERYIRRIWSQLAERFRDYGGRLIMESMNEPRLMNNPHEWWWEANNPECQEAADCLNRLNQVFVDTVRAAGGENANRYLMVPAYDANPAYACDPQFVLPTDTVENRIIVSAHAYTPYAFALEMPGRATFSVESAANRAEVTGFMDQLYKTFVSKGIPVLIGEFGALAKTDAQGDHMQDRVDFTAFYVASARARGMTVCWWDNHAFEGNGEKFGLIDRRTMEWKAPKILEAMMTYCGE